MLRLKCLWNFVVAVGKHSRKQLQSMVINNRNLEIVVESMDVDGLF